MVMLFGAFEGPKKAPKEITGILSIVRGMMVLIATICILFGWTLAILIIVAGRKLRQRASHTFCLVIAGIECLSVPLGTILGVSTIVVLIKESLRKLFQEAEAGSPFSSAPAARDGF
jgi:hypothetical protein